MARGDFIENPNAPKPIDLAMEWLDNFNRETGAENAPDFYHAMVEETPLDTPNL